MEGIGVKHNVAKAKYWLQKSVDKGFPEGELNLGVQMELEGRFSEAFMLFKSAAVKGCARAYANLGDLYRDGRGVAKNINKARQMYEKAIEHEFSFNLEARLADESDLISNERKF